VSGLLAALAFLTPLPVGARRPGPSTLAWFPVAGALVGAVVGGAWALAAELWPPLVAAAVVVAVDLVVTGALHLDGLADTADGLGSRRPADGALEVMRRGDVGPFGLVTLLLVLLLQVAALEGLVQTSTGRAALVAALVLSRLVLPALCSRGIPAARPEGLGAMVAGTVGRVALAVSAVVSVLVLLVVALVLAPTYDSVTSGSWLHLVAFLVGPAVVTGLFARRCIRRFGGVTGDVLGACVEVAFTAALLVAAL
jgi:adenosylcobinamide-GDP ribazoletransferase